jgi:hypothetical protein
MVSDMAPSYGVPSNIGAAVAQMESGQGTTTSNLMGLTQPVADMFGLDDWQTDSTQNAMGGLGLLGNLYNQYGNWTDALAVYNGGADNPNYTYANGVLGIANTLTGQGVNANNAGVGGSLGYDFSTGLPSTLTPGTGGGSAAGQAATGADAASRSYPSWLQALLNWIGGGMLRVAVLIIALIFITMGLHALITGQAPSTTVKRYLRK